jgi:hypothetical protein
MTNTSPRTYMTTPTDNNQQNSHEQPVELRSNTRPRQGGQLQCKLWIAENFDAPDPEIERLFDGDEP